MSYTIKNLKQTMNKQSQQLSSKQLRYAWKLLIYK